MEATNTGQQTSTGSSEPKVEPRMSYTINGTSLTVKRGSETLVASVDNLPDDVRQHLMMAGLTDYLQRACARFPKEQKMDAVESAMDRLDEAGMKVFEHKPRGFQSQGPRKQDKIAALAALKGVTPTAVEKALSNHPKEAQDKILNHPDVMAKLSEMSSDVQL